MKIVFEISRLLRDWDWNIYRDGFITQRKHPHHHFKLHSKPKMDHHGENHHLAILINIEADVLPRFIDVALQWALQGQFDRSMTTFQGMWLSYKRNKT